ncbi:MAG: MazG nucleotide pyrophosphohydrolase domain-containing protein, partial [Thermodesulfobacteriota bacterium]
KRGHGSIVGGVPRDFPSLLRAVKMSKKAARAGFDWERPEQVLEKVEEEISELKEAMREGKADRLEHELGDVLLALANLARFLDLNPEVAMMSANDRFERRFREMEKIASETGISIEQSDMRTLDRLWEMAKKSTS